MGPAVIAVDKRATNPEIEREDMREMEVEVWYSEGLLCGEGMSTFFPAKSGLMWSFSIMIIRNIQ